MKKNLEIKTIEHKRVYEDGDVPWLPYVEKSFHEPILTRCLYCEYCQSGHPTHTNEVLCFFRNKIIKRNI